MQGVFSVRQEPLRGRTAHTNCGMYLLASLLATALPGARRASPRQGWVGKKSGLFEPPEDILKTASLWKFQRCYCA